MSRAAEINRDAWGRRRLLTVLAGGVAAALAFLTGLGLAVYYAVQPSEQDAVTPLDPAAPVAPVAHGQAERDRLAAAPMLAVDPEDAVSGTPATSPGPNVTVPPSTGIGPAELPAGFPQTPPGAVGQLGMIVTAVLQGMSIDHATAVHKEWAMPGAPPAPQWRMTKNVQSFLASAGQTGQAKATSVSVTATPVAAQVKGTDGDSWVLACVLVDVRAVVAREARIAYGHCERMQWHDDRWMIAPGTEPAPAPSTWPGTDLALSAGWRTWVQEGE